VEATLDQSWRLQLYWCTKFEWWRTLFTRAITLWFKTEPSLVSLVDEYLTLSIARNKSINLALRCPGSPVFGSWEFRFAEFSQCFGGVGKLALTFNGWKVWSKVTEGVNQLNQLYLTFDFCTARPPSSTLIHQVKVYHMLPFLHPSNSPQSVFIQPAHTRIPGRHIQRWKSWSQWYTGLGHPAVLFVWKEGIN
jgi:hypothetical protein